MKLATLLLVIASNQGYWFGGQEGIITLREAARGGLPAADITWELMFSHVRIASGVAAIAPPDGAAEVRIVVPQCRERIRLHWVYRLKERATGKELEQGEVPLELFPDNLLDGLAERVGKRRLWVLDPVNGIPKILDRAKVSYTRIESTAALQFARADVVLIGPNMLSNSAFDQQPLEALARHGASIMILEQDVPERLMGYDLSRRNAPAHMEFRADHPLFRDLLPVDLQTWILPPQLLSVVQLPIDEPALELAYYGPEAPGHQPRPIDAVMVSKTVGSGRFVLCQIPLGDWSVDPRSQIFLRNAIDYLLTRSQPTPWPSERTVAPAAPMKERTIPAIPVSPGGRS